MRKYFECQLLLPISAGPEVDYSMATAASVHFSAFFLLGQLVFILLVIFVAVINYSVVKTWSEVEPVAG